MPHRSLYIAVIVVLMIVFVPPARAAIQCYDCHGTVISVDFRPLDASYRNISSGAFLGNHQTHMDTPASPSACEKCHPGSTSYSTSHRDGKIEISSRIKSSPQATPYNNTTSIFPQTAMPVLGSCSNVNCHFESGTPVWGSAIYSSTSHCNQCHEKTAPLSATHATHKRYSTGLMGRFSSYAACASCHVNYASPPSFRHATSAGQRPIKVSVGGYNSGSLTYLPSQAHGAFGNCTNLYCHSPGTKNAAPFTAPNQAATWGGALGCAGCHSAIPLTGSHNQHVATTYGVPAPCYKCHAATVTSGAAISSIPKHVNGLINIAFNSTTTAVFGRYSGLLTPMQKNPGSGYGKCENVYCHSSGQGAGGSWPPTYSVPKWGTSASGKCPSCHDNGYHDVGSEINSGSHGKHMNYGFSGNDINGCGICHYGAGFASRQTDCSQCHFGPANLTNLHVNHKVDVSFITAYGGTYNGTPQPGDGYSTCSNSYCHSNGASVSTGSVTANTSPAWGSGVMACNGCHGNKSYSDFRKAFPLYTTNRPATKANSHAIHAQHGATCKQCHIQVTTDNTGIVNTTLHVSKTYNVSADTVGGVTFSYTYNVGGGSCTNISCHGGSTAQWGSTACRGCHSVAQGNRVAAASQFGANSHHIQGSVTDAQCYQCHWEADSNGYINNTYHSGATTSGSTVDLVVYGSGSRPTSYTVGSTAVQYHYTTSVNRAGLQKITTHCLGCHSTANDAAQPFGDGKTPKQYAWDGTSVATRYSQSGSTSWGKYTSASYSYAAKKKIAKAFSAHGNANANKRYWDTANGVDGDMSSQNSSGAVNVQCFDCHNSHGSSASGITSRYSSATGRNRGALLKDTVAGKGGYAVAYKPYTGGSTANKNRRNPGASLCLDCHITPTAGAKPWGYTSTFGASQAILGYWDSPYYGPGAFGSQTRYPYKSTGHKGGHFGAYTSLTSPASKTIGGLCTPCHDPHGVSTSLGSNMKYAVPLLKGTFLTSPYKEDVTPAGNAYRTSLYGQLEYHIDQNTFASNITLPAVTGIKEADSQFAGLCLNCHSKAGLTNGVNGGAWKGVDRIHESVKGWGANGKHNYSCSKCHNPHNSRLPKLMATNCLNSQHKGRSAFNPSAVVSGSNGECDGGYYGWGCPDGYCGSGDGRIPGSYRGDDQGDHTVTCHENQTGGGTDQRWNTKTPW